MSNNSNFTPDTQQSDAPMRIDLNAVIRDKTGRKARFVPKWLVRRLERTICVDRLNKLLADNHPRTGADFCRGVLNDLNVTVHVHNSDLLPPPEQRRVIIACNHPLGGLDGMALIDYFTSYYGGTVHFVVNDLLMALKPLNNVFVPINKHGSQSRDALKSLDEALAGDDPVIIFPAGLVSRLGKNGVVADLEWKKTFVNKAVKYSRDIIPAFFSGQNSKFFYKFAQRRKRLGIKFNIEMIYLPREVFRSEGKTFDVYIGPAIPHATLAGGNRAGETAAHIRDIVYKLSEWNHNPS